MQKVQLYIENKLVDMFDDEVIQLTSTIQDVRDIGKVFTDYSQTFTVPASKTNNKIFKHFYNYFITGGAFDTRKKKTAEIHINYTPFRRGKIYLNSVKMKMNKPYAYVLIFYGETVSLKDLIGDDELSNLSYLENFNHEYDEPTVRDGFSNGLDFTINSNLKENAIIYPLITTKKRLFYNSNVTGSFYNSSGNLYHNTSLQSQNVRGLEYTDLKPAIRLIDIIEAIESQYNIQFTRSIRKTDGTDRNTFFSSEQFIGNGSSTNYWGLYMWLHRSKGDLFEYDLEGTDISTILDDFVAQSGNYGNTSFSDEIMTVDLSSLPLSSNIEGYNVRFDLYPDSSSSDKTYTISILDGITGEVLSSRTGFGNKNTYIDIIDDIRTPKQFKFLISSSSTIIYDTSNPPKITVATFDNDRNPVEVDIWTSSNNSMVNEVVMGNVMPKMKVIDFLTGFFKMFNLTAYYIDNIGDVNSGKIYVDTLDNFYLDAQYNPLGGTIDIDKYLDIKEHIVDSVLPYTDIDFQYKETNVVLMENHLAKFNEVFGNSEYNVRRAFPGEIDRGTKYEIQLPFSHMKYERLYDLADNPAGGTTKGTSIQWGYCATGEFNAVNEDAVYPEVPEGDYDRTAIAPLIFYAISEETGQIKKINWTYNNTPTGIDVYWRPSNSYDDGTPTIAPAYSLNFDQEFDEWQENNYGNESNSLFKIYYKNYIESVFNAAKRLFKVTAYLPTRIIVNYRLNDQIKIQDQMFRINSITTNLTNGKSELELLNIFQSEIVE